MPNTNLENAKTNMKSRIRNRAAVSTTPRDLGRLAKSARFVGLIDDSDVETELNTQMAAAIPSASIDDLVELSEGINELRDRRPALGGMTSTDQMVEGSRKFLHANSVQPAISVSGDLSYENGVVSYTTPTSAALQVVATVGDLPADASPGDQAVVQSNNKLYIKTADGWYAVALINTAPSVSGNDASYTLATDGTPTVITLTATDPENDPVSFSHSVTSGDLNGTTVDQADNVFTVTPHASQNATFELTFSANDSVNVVTTVSSFSLAHGVNWDNITQTVTEDTTFNQAFSAPHNIERGLSDFITWEKTSGANPGTYIVASSTSANSGNNTTTGFFAFMKVDDPSTYTRVSNFNQGKSGSPQWDNFGKGINAYDNFIIIGAETEDDPAHHNDNNTGMAYLYNIDTATYTTLDVPPENPYTALKFGRGVAVNSTHCAVGAPETSAYGTPYGYPAGSGSNGVVYLYDNSTGNFINSIAHPDPSTSESNRFGTTLAMTNQYLAVSAWGVQYPIAAGNTGYRGVGAVYVFDITDPMNPSLVRTIYHPDFIGLAFSGTSDVPYNQFGGMPGANGGMMVFAGDKLAIGSPYTAAGEKAQGTPPVVTSGYWANAAGKVYVYDVTNNDPAIDCSLTTYGTKENLGGSLGFDGDYVFTRAKYSKDIFIFDATDGSLVHTITNGVPSDQDNYLSAKSQVLGVPNKIISFDQQGIYQNASAPAKLNVFTY